MRSSALSLASTLVFLAACGNQVTVIEGQGGGGGEFTSTTTTTSDVSPVTTTGDVNPVSTTGDVNPVTTTSTGIGGEGGTGGIGQPSDIYPAPHPDGPQVVNSGGAILTSPNIIPIVFAEDDKSFIQGAVNFDQQIGQSAYWKAIASEYGIGAMTSSALITLTDSAPGTIDDSEIQTWLAAKLNSNDAQFPTATANSIYEIIYPALTQVTLSDQMGGSLLSCQGFGGYHNSVKLDAAHGNLDVAYAVLPRCNFFQGSSGVSAPASHEFIEAATDPHPFHDAAYQQPDFNHEYWAIALGGGEVGDMCAQNPDAFGNQPGIDDFVQRSWSNVAAKAGHNPCVPAPAGEVFFSAVPVMKDKMTFGDGGSFNGVRIPEGETKTIDIDLFSDGPTNGPFFVDAEEDGALGGSLSLNLDESQGQNGQVLHLTITVNQASQFDFETFTLFSSDNNGIQHTWAGIVGNQ